MAVVAVSALKHAVPTHDRAGEWPTGLRVDFEMVTTLRVHSADDVAGYSVHTYWLEQGVR